MRHRLLLPTLFLLAALLFLLAFSGCGSSASSGKVKGTAIREGAFANTGSSWKEPLEPGSEILLREAGGALEVVYVGKGGSFSDELPVGSWEVLQTAAPGSGREACAETRLTSPRRFEVTEGLTARVALRYAYSRC